MKRVLALQHIWDDPPGYLGEIMEEHGIPYDIVNVEENPIPDIAHYAAIIALGGPQHANAHDKYPYLLQEKQVLREVVEQDIPFLGICLGGQVLAGAVGAAVTRHSMTELGFYAVQLTDEGQHDPLYQGLPGYQMVFQWHEDTFAIPPQAVRLATSENTLNQAFRIGHRIYAVQYHMELTPAMLQTWIHLPEYEQEVIKILGPNALEQVERQRAEHYPLYLAHGRIVFENFLRLSGCL